MSEQTTTSSKANIIGCGALAAIAIIGGAFILGAFVIDAEARRTVVNATLAMFAAVAVMALSYGAYVALESALMFRAKRKAAQNLAEFNVYETKDGDLHIRERNHAVLWRAASRDPRVYANTHWEPPTIEERDAFSAWIGAQQRTPITAQATAAPVLQIAAPPIDLLDVLRRTRKVLIVGPENAGKTSLLTDIISQRLATSAVIVIDPHGNADDWPAGCEVVGPGRRYDLIEQRFRDVAHELDRRYKAVAGNASARGTFTAITVVIDEWSQLVDQVDNGAEFIRMMLTESRKVNIAAFVAGHSERVESLGIKGKGDLKSGFGIVRLYYDQVTHARRQTIDYSDGNGERAAMYQHTGGGIATPAPAMIAPVPTAPEPKPTAEEQQIIGLHQTGNSYNAIARAIYGSTGGKQTEQIKAIIAKFG